MDTNALVSLDLSAGAEVVSALERHGIHIEIAMWMVTPQYEDGRLVITSEDLPQNDILSDYEKVVAILREKFLRELPLFSILRPDDPFVKELRERFGQTRDAGDRYIEDGYIYKIA